MSVTGFLGETGDISRSDPVTARLLRRTERYVLAIRSDMDKLRSDTAGLRTVAGATAVAVRKNSASVNIGIEPRINVIEGTGIAVSVVDSPANSEVAITASLTASGVTPGTYANATVTVDGLGRVTVASAGAAAPAPANPTAQVGPSAINGVAATFMRSDAAPKLADTAVTPGTYARATITVDAQGRITVASAGGGITGSGTAGVVPKWATSTSLGDSLFSDDGSSPAMQSIGQPKAIFDTSTLAVVDSTDKAFLIWAPDPAGVAVFVTGYSATPGSLAQWSSDANYPASVRDSQITYTGTYLTVPDLNGVGAILVLGDLTSGVEIKARNGSGINTINCYGSGARFEMSGNTTAEVLKINGKFAATGDSTFQANILQTVAGKGIRFREGGNAIMGVATLVAGVAVVNTSAVTANSRILLTRQTVAGTLGASVDVTARTAGTSFTITANGSILDTSTVMWVIFEPS